MGHKIKIEPDKKYKVALVGSRKYKNYNEFKDIVLGIIKPEQIELIISGGAAGADTLAKKFASEFDLPLKEFIPNWSNGRSAGPRRNIQIISLCDICIAFPTKSSRGTLHDIKLCKKTHKPYFVHHGLES
jgi:predicted Rossmann fold nucleotide-binding protein DprA/Smf involved in DNA uptake